MPETVGFLLGRFRTAGPKTAFIEPDGSAVSYAELLGLIEGATEILNANDVTPGASVQLRGDFSAASAAWLIALWRVRAIVTPVAPSSYEKADEFADVAAAEWIAEPATNQITRAAGNSKHSLYDILRSHKTPGLIIFSSGTTGASKGALHDATRLLGKFQNPGKDFVTLAFLLFDHIAGIDTLFYCLANGSTIVCPPDRGPSTICRLIEDHRVEVLPTAPSFLNLLLLSNVVENHDLSSLKIITYGAEMMPQGLLERVTEAFPKARIIQKYGTSEIGALRSQSEDSRSRWIRLGGAEWRVANGLLEIKTRTAMLGYLNAPSPFSKDGWYKTGDQVEVKGEFIRFLGRDSDIINVGGQKVFPAEVEAAIRNIDGVAEVAVFGKAHPILGATVCARVRMKDATTTAPAVRTAIRTGLAGALEPYKIPQKIEITQDALTTARFKQQRG